LNGQGVVNCQGEGCWRAIVILQQMGEALSPGMIVVLLNEVEEVRRKILQGKSLRP
jgi:hypothetical protein